MVGAIDPRKRQDLFLLIAREVKEHFPEVKFFIIGDIYGSDPKKVLYKQKVISMCDELGLNGDVIFTGYRDDIPRLLKMMDVFVLTSKRDPFPGTIIEAMFSGKPVVSYAIDGIVEMIENERTGFLINSSEPEDYAEKILLLLKDESIKVKMGIEAREKAIELFDIKKHVFKIENLYQELLDKN
jgi:glycosyltransferase involved in cell wall biosynthesis